MFNISLFIYFKVFSAVCNADELDVCFVEFKNNVLQSSVTPVYVFVSIQ